MFGLSQESVVTANYLHRGDQDYPWMSRRLRAHSAQAQPHLFVTDVRMGFPKRGTPEHGYGCSKVAFAKESDQSQSHPILLLPNKEIHRLVEEGFTEHYGQKVFVNEILGLPADLPPLRLTRLRFDYGHLIDVTSDGDFEDIVVEKTHGLWLRNDKLILAAVSA